MTSVGYRRRGVLRVTEGEKGMVMENVGEARTWGIRRRGNENEDERLDKRLERKDCNYRGNAREREGREERGSHRTFYADEAQEREGRGRRGRAVRCRVKPVSRCASGGRAILWGTCFEPGTLLLGDGARQTLALAVPPLLDWMSFLIPTVCVCGGGDR